MNEELHKLEEASRASPAYRQAMALLEQREQLERKLHEIDRALDALAVAGQLARIDKLRHSLLTTSKLFPLAG